MKNQSKKLVCLVAAGTCLLFTPMHVFAAGDPLSVINNLSDFLFSVIRAVGVLLTGWGIVQVGLSVNSHDAGQRSNGFFTLAGGIIVMFAKEILNMITAG